MTDPASQRLYECRSCGLLSVTESMTGRVPLYCPLCRPRVARRGGAGGVEVDTPAYRLALATTTLRLGIESARRRLLDVHLDDRASTVQLRRAVTAAITALNDAESDQTKEIVSAQLFLDVSNETETPVIAEVAEISHRSATGG